MGLDGVATNHDRLVSLSLSLKHRDEATIKMVIRFRAESLSKKFNRLIELGVRFVGFALSLQVRSEVVMQFDAIGMGLDRLVQNRGNLLRCSGVFEQCESNAGKGFKER